MSVASAINVKEPRHYTIHEYISEFPYVKDYLKFAFVRNPWDRCLSLYFYLFKNEKQPKMTFDFFLRLFAFDNPVFSSHFNEKGVWDVHYKTQYSYIDGIPMDFIGRYENLQQDFNIICDKIGIQQQELPHVNKSRHKHYTEYYDDETRQIVAEKYAKDIEYFGYKFG